MVLICIYRLVKKKGGFLYVETSEKSYCPICNTLLAVRAARQRVMWLNEEEKEILIIRRLYCEKCKRVHHELPDCLVPYKRYGAKAIERIIDSRTTYEDAPCPSGTVRRIRKWWAAVKPYFLNILQTLAERLGVAFGKPPAFRETVRATANSNNWVFAHQLCTRSASRPG